MKALAIDSVSACISIKAVNERLTAKISINIGLHQSEAILPAIDKVLSEVNLPVSDLEFISLCQGPGSFTGLRLGFAAAKAISFASNCPIYAIETMDCYALPYKNWQGAVISVLDAKKDKFYGAIYHNGKKSSETIDGEIEEFIKMIDEEEHALVVGPDSEYFCTSFRETKPNQKISFFPHCDYDCCEQLLFLAQEKIIKKEPPLESYEGPFYIRSET